MFFITLSLLITMFIIMLPNATAQNSDKELFLVASKAFEDGFYDVAIGYIDQLLKEFPTTKKEIEAKLLLGQCYFFKNQYLKAYDVFQGLLGFSEYKDATLFWLGETYLKGADYRQAERQYRELIKFYPDSIYTPQAYYSIGWIFFEQGNYEETKNVLQELLKKFPDHQLSEDASFKLGESEYNLHHYEETINYFKTYLQHYPQTTRQGEVYFYIGESYYYQEDPLTAVTYYAKASAVAYDAKLILMAKVSLGWCYLKLQKHQLSQENFEEAYTFAQERGILSDDVFLGQANLYTEMAEHKKALDAYNQLIEQFPNSQRILEAYLGKANIHYFMEQYPQAIQAYQQIINQIKDDPTKSEILEKTYFGLAWSYLKNGDIDTCIQTFAAIKNQTKNNTVKISALTQIGDAYQDVGQFEKAIKIYDQILEDYPQSPYTDYVQYRQGIALLKIDRVEAATLSFQSLRANFPNSKYLNDIDYYLAVAYFKKGDWAMASTQIQSFIQKIEAESEFLAEANYILALSYYNLSQFNEAEKTFQKILKNFPDQSTIIQNTHIYLAKCTYKSGKISEAIKQLKLLIQKYPQTEIEQEALIWLGDHYIEASDLETATTYYHQFIKNFPGSDKLEMVYYDLSQAYQAQGQFDKAINILKQIKPYKDRVLYAKASLAIADIFSKDLDPESAVETYRNIIESSPEFRRDAHIRIAEVFRNNKDYPQAIGAYRDGFKASQGNSKLKDVEIQFLIADTYEFASQTKEAIEEYLKIPYLYPEQTSWIIRSYLRMARIFEDKEQWNDAILTYNKVLGYQTEETKFAQERLDWIAQKISTNVN